MLACCLVDEEFSKSISKRDKKVEQFLQAKRQIENLICTHRESLLGSSAWNGGYLDEMKVRMHIPSL